VWSEGNLRPAFNLCSFSARLVLAFIKVNPELMRIVQLHKPFTIDGVEITALDANQLVEKGLEACFRENC
jgi:hypothetical protein